MSSLFTPRPGAPAYYRPPAQFSQAAQPQPVPNVTDDYERWYTELEPTPNKRMLLSLRSGIDSEIGWALDRLCRLCDNEQFMLKAHPGLTDALFEWPEWYADEGYKAVSEISFLFAPNKKEERKRRHALESLFILRNASVNDPNAMELIGHPRTPVLIAKLIINLRPESDENVEFLLLAVELLQAVAPHVLLPSEKHPNRPNILPPLLKLLSTTENRSLIVATLCALTGVFSSPYNPHALTSDSPAFHASIRYLPLFIDKNLVGTCLNYMYVHLSHPAMARAFLLHPDLSSTIRLLVSFLLSEQTEETCSLDIGGPVQTVSAQAVTTKNHELTQEELESMLSKAEPNRCYDWMRAMFVPKVESEITQVDFWNFYKETFYNYAERQPLLVASEVIKNVSIVFPQAQAMVVAGPPQKFVVRGVDRRKVVIPTEKFKCKWLRGSCEANAFESPGDLYEHVLHHLSSTDSSEHRCLWSHCPCPTTQSDLLRAHILTHIPSSQSPAKDPSQSDTITLPSKLSQYPTPNPTTRQPPPPRHTKLTYKRAMSDPPSNALTALLCIRILFRTSFASVETAPRADKDHFGFPGIVEEIEENVEDVHGDSEENEREGERRGRKAFVGVRKLMENVMIKDEVLMSWITEMVDAGISGTT